MRGLNACELDGGRIFGVGRVLSGLVFPIDLVSEGAVHLLVYVDIKEWEVTLSFYFHGKLYIVFNPVEVIQEVHEFFLSMWPDGKCSSTYLYQQVGL